MGMGWGHAGAQLEWLAAGAMMPASDRRQALNWSHSSCMALTICVLLYRCTHSPGWGTIVEADDGCQASGIQNHSWRG